VAQLLVWHSHVTLSPNGQHFAGTSRSPSPSKWSCFLMIWKVWLCCSSLIAGCINSEATEIESQRAPRVIESILALQEQGSVSATSRQHADYFSSTSFFPWLIVSLVMYSNLAGIVTGTRALQPCDNIS